MVGVKKGDLVPGVANGGLWAPLGCSSRGGIFKNGATISSSSFLGLSLTSSSSYGELTGQTFGKADSSHAGQLTGVNEKTPLPQERRRRRGKGRRWWRGEGGGETT